MFEYLFPWNRYRCKLITISDLWGRTLQFLIENLIWPARPGPSDQAAAAVRRSVYLQMWNVDILQSLLSRGRGMSFVSRTIGLRGHHESPWKMEKRPPVKLVLLDWQRRITAQAHLGPKSKGRPLLTSHFNMKAAQNSDGLSTTRHGRL